MIISPFNPTGASCLIPPPNREPIPAAMITKVVFILPFPLYFLNLFIIFSYLQFTVLSGRCSVLERPLSEI